jgi:serine/threonine protein kinase
MSAPVPAPLGIVAHYNLLERLDPSGPGDLYRARDTKVGRTVAVRLLPADFTADPARLIADASGLSALSHPNVTALFGVGEHAGRVYLAFEFQKGQSLRGELAGRPLNVRRAVEIGIQIADAVADAHAHGYGHAGLSADSVVISAKGRAKIPAFDLASQSGFDRNDGAGRLIDYNAPEEARGERPDDRSDVYSVGAILYEMLTMRRPMHRGASAPSSSNPKVPKELDVIVLKALSPNAESRFQSAIAFAGALRGSLAVLDALGVAGDEEDVVPVHSSSPGRVAAIVAALLVAVLAWWLWN